MAAGATGANKDERTVVPAGRLADLYAERKEFHSVKQHLEQRLALALNEPIVMTPQFATRFVAG